MWPFLLEGSAATPPPSTFPRAVTGISVQAPSAENGNQTNRPNKASTPSPGGVHAESQESCGMAAVPSHRSPAFTSDLPSLFTDSPLHRWGQISLVPLSAWPTVRTQLEVPDSPTVFVTPWAGTLWKESSRSHVPTFVLRFKKHLEAHFVDSETEPRQEGTHICRHTENWSWDQSFCLPSWSHMQWLADGCDGAVR